MIDPGGDTGPTEGRILGPADFGCRTVAEDIAYDPTAPGNAGDLPDDGDEPGYGSPRPPIWAPVRG